MNESGLKDYLDSKAINYKRDYPLSKLTGFRTGGPASFVAAPRDPQELCSLVGFLRDYLIPFHVVGKGTNLLALDSGFDGCIVLTEKLCALTSEGRFLRVGAGLALARLCKYAQARSMTGLEFAFGIPGSVGGAVYMNAGAYGGEISERVSSVTVFDINGEVKVLSREELSFGYRSSALQQSGDTVLEARFELAFGSRVEIAESMRDILQRRADKQPLELPSCGSTFKRPKGAYASALIEQCGLKGRRVGGASVSVKHSGFIVNDEGATSDDILNLIEIVQDEVMSKTGFSLEPEIEILR